MCTCASETERGSDTLSPCSSQKPLHVRSGAEMSPQHRTMTELRGEGDERKLEGETQKGNRHLKHRRCLTRYREQSGAKVFTPPSFHLVDTGMLLNVSALMTEN